ncbi:MAG: hypothetical protein AB7P02_30410 [Alphaproteobacteria bacterium]
MAGLYTLGAVVHLEVTFRNTVSGALVDPTDVVLEIKPPTGSNETPTPTNASTGVYSHDYSPTLEGLYAYRWEGTGANADAVEGHFTVKKSAVI